MALNEIVAVGAACENTYLAGVRYLDEQRAVARVVCNQMPDILRPGVVEALHAECGFAGRRWLRILATQVRKAHCLCLRASACFVSMQM